MASDLASLANRRSHKSPAMDAYVPLFLRLTVLAQGNSKLSGERPPDSPLGTSPPASYAPSLSSSAPSTPPLLTPPNEPSSDYVLYKDPHPNQEYHGSPDMRHTPLPSLSIHPFLRQPRASEASSSSPTPSLSRSPSPPSDLLDDDPFAASPAPIAHPSTPPSTPSFYEPSDTAPLDWSPPNHPSFQPFGSDYTSRHSALYSSPSVPSLRTNPHAVFPKGRQVLPAYKRPAFQQRPSLPSLDVLAQNDYVCYVKARKGTLGARLPVEPWAMDGTSSDNTSSDDIHGRNSDPLLDPPHTGSDQEHSGDALVHSDSVAASEDPYTGLTSHEVEEPVFTESPTELLSPFHEHDTDSPMFSSLYGALSRLSSPTHSRSSSASATSPISDSHARPNSDVESDSSSGRTQLSRDNSEPRSLSPVFDSLDVRVQSPDPAAAPYNSAYSVPGGFLDVDHFQPGTSADTIRPHMPGKLRTDSPISSDEESSESSTEDYYEFADTVDEEEEAADADGYGGASSRDGERYRDEYQSAGSSRGRGMGAGEGSRPNDPSRGFYGGGAGGGGRDGDDGRRDDRRMQHAPSDEYVDSDSDESEDEEKKPVHAPNPSRSVEKSRPVDSDNTDDDDVPLARSIPTALKAQRTIRRQVRDETDERRAQRSLRLKERQDARSSDRPLDARRSASRPRQPSQEPPRSPLPAPRAFAGAQEVNIALVPVGRRSTSRPRQPSQDIPRSPVPAVRTLIGAQEVVTPAPVARTRVRAQTLSTQQQPVSANELGQRLMNMQVTPAGSTRPSLRRPSVEAHSSRPSHDDAASRPPPMASEPVPQERTLRLQRSFHRTRVPDLEPAPGAAPSSFNYRIGRSATSATSKPTSLPGRSYVAEQLPPSRSKSVRRRVEEPVAQQTRPSPPPELPLMPVAVAAPVAGGSAFQVVSREAKPQMWQQRVFVFDLQRFHMVEIGQTTTARDVIETLNRQGHLDQWAGAGGWMLFEIAQDFGMERPVRGFESVQDVLKSWDKDRTVNMLLAKKTTMHATLQPSAIPGSSPRNGGWVEWEIKRGSWKKRWLELREQGLWLAKKDNGKDEVFLCSVSNFDAYTVTRGPKAPKPFVFSIKSTDNLTFFESAADYVHVFSCTARDGQNWIEKIMLARSYIINQERKVIQPITASVPTSGGAQGLSRAGTRKGPRPPQPLLDVTPQTAAAAALATQGNVFEPGSLLAKR